MKGEGEERARKINIFVLSGDSHFYVPRLISSAVEATLARTKTLTLVAGACCTRDPPNAEEHSHKIDDARRGGNVWRKAFGAGAAAAKLISSF